MDVRRQGNDNAFADTPAHTGARHRDNGGSTLLSKVLAIVLIVVGVLVLAWFAMKAFGSLSTATAVKGKQYQAVFLTNGQVYFGKVSKVDSSYVKLQDIYYLQVQQQVQPKDNNSSQQPQVSLAKLGGELHGPEDVMYISRQQVLFWENLKDDGKVTKAIKDYKSGGNK